MIFLHELKEGQKVRVKYIDRGFYLYEDDEEKRGEGIVKTYKHELNEDSYEMRNKIEMDNGDEIYDEDDILEIEIIR